MKRRVFVAINLPEAARKKLGAAVENLKPLFGPDTRFLDVSNWHLTLSFLGYQGDSCLPAIIAAIRDTVKNLEKPEAEFVKIAYGPPGKLPRMIWLLGSQRTSENLFTIKQALENNLSNAGIAFRREDRQFTAHLTLARFEARSRPGLPDIETDLRLRFSVESLDLMESRLRRSGAQYELLSQLNFEDAKNEIHR